MLPRLNFAFQTTYPFVKWSEHQSTSLDFVIKTKGKFSYTDEGNGEAIILLYGLFGSVNNYKTVIQHFKTTHRVIVPMLPIYDLGINISVSALTGYVTDLINFLELKQVHVVGNSLGGHIALLYTLQNQEKVKSLTLVGSSGLFENGMGDSYPKRSDYEYIKRKAETTFYKPETASKELIDEIYATVNNRIKALQILYLAKSTIRYNLKNELHKITCNCCIIWGKKDAVTPPCVAEEFHQYIPHSSLWWIDNCGHVPMLETPDEFNSILSNFYNQLSLQKTSLNTEASYFTNVAFLLRKVFYD